MNVPREPTVGRPLLTLAAIGVFLLNTGTGNFRSEAQAQSLIPQTAPQSAVPQRDQQTVLASALYRRMTQVNAHLQSYKAHLRADVTMKSFPFLKPTLTGTIFYERPDKQAIIFDNLPPVVSQFTKVYPHIESPEQWPDRYTIAPRGEANGIATFRLVPTTESTVEHLDVQVDEATAAIIEYAWTYKDGGLIVLDQSFTSIDGNQVVKAETGHIDFSGYKADVAAVFSDYQLNVPIEGSVFPA